MRLIIIIGLPGSGKTTYFHEKLKHLGFQFFDDFVSSMCNGTMIREIKHGITDVCIADPRLCNFEIFKRVMKVIEVYIDKSSIEIILFENDKDKCLLNASKRTNKNVNKTIEFNSTIYNLDNYNDYDCKIEKIIT
jgi:RNase adaptor protein for sRNA GlmZ degradation